MTSMLGYLVVFLFFGVVSGHAPFLPRFAEQMMATKAQIQLQTQALDLAADKQEDIAQKIHGVEVLARQIKLLSDISKRDYDELVNSLGYASRIQWQTLSELSARVSQLQYRINNLHLTDPYVENFDSEIGNYWFIVDFEGKSDWAFRKSGEEGDRVIAQTADLHQPSLPSTMLLLKSHLLAEGFVSTQVHFMQDSLAVRGNGSGGVVFGYQNPQHFWMVELSKDRTGDQIIVKRGIDYECESIAKTSAHINVNRGHQLDVRFSSKKVEAFLDSRLLLEITGPLIAGIGTGSTGIFTRSGKISFGNFASGPPYFDAITNQNSYLSKGAGILTHKVSEEEAKNIKPPRLQEVDTRELLLGSATSVAEPAKVASDYTAGPQKTKEEFLPNSPVHVPESDGAEPTYKGYFEKENARYRENITNIVTAEPEPSSCFAYSAANVNASDWANVAELDWIQTSEFGIDRMTLVRSVEAGAEAEKLLLKGFGCYEASYSVKIRLEGESEAGLVFRSTDRNNTLVASLNTNTHLVELKRQRDGIISTIGSAYKPDLHSNNRYHLEVIDHSHKNAGTIEILVDNKSLVKSITESAKEPGAAGLWIQNGHALFDSFSIAPSQK